MPRGYRVEMRAASDDADVNAGTRERRGDEPADRAGSYYRYSHE